MAIILKTRIRFVETLYPRRTSKIWTVGTWDHFINRFVCYAGQSWLDSLLSRGDRGPHSRSYSRTQTGYYCTVGQGWLDSFESLLSRGDRGPHCGRHIRTQNRLFLYNRKRLAGLPILLRWQRPSQLPL